MDKKAIEEFISDQVSTNLRQVKEKVEEGRNFFKHKLVFDRGNAVRIILGIPLDDKNKNERSKENFVLMEEHYGHDNVDSLISMLFSCVKTNFENALLARGHYAALCDSGRHPLNGPEYKIVIKNESLQNEVQEAKDFISGYKFVPNSELQF